MRIKKRYIVLAIVAIAAIALAVPTGPQPGHVLDEAMLAGVKVSALNPIGRVNVADDYFHGMDRGALLTTKNEINGRNMWLLWTAGNDRFWDLSANLSFGNVDLLKTLSSYDPDKDSSISNARRQELKSIYRFKRDNRWSYFGMINEPCYEQANEGDKVRFGLWLDRTAANCGPDPFADEAKYPGVRIGARGKNVPVGSYYGYGSGVVGLRLFPNPAFDEAAEKKWDPVRFYSDASYYKDPKLIRPFRVGMSCGFCHVGPNPVHPPPDPEHPAWEHLSSTAGAQYLWMDRVFSWESKPDNFLVQLFRTWRPGTLDVSFVSSDNIDNPRTMNAVYNLEARMHQAAKFGKERLAEENKDSLQLNNFVSPESPLAAFYKSPNTVYTMHVLKDGSDSVGVIGALNRVYINIGTFSEEWLLHFRPLLGGQRVTPIAVKDLRKHSVYWQATEAQTFDMAAFLLKAGVPHRLSEVDPKLVQRESVSALGKNVFAERCLRCHSSKLPNIPAEANLGACSGNYLDCWKRYWQWTKTDDFKTQARVIANRPDFLEDNYLSTDFRVPITLLQTNACSSLATNAIAGNIWSEFSSETYKSLPSVGDITYYQPFTGEKRVFHMPGGGRGYIRPPSLVSVWATAPYLLNNSVGTFQPSPAVEARLKTFEESIGQMLWPERRQQDSILGDKIPGMIERTSVPSYLRVPASYLPNPLRPLLGVSATLLPALFSANGPQAGLVLGPFPTGMPVEMLANLQVTLDQGGALDGLKLDADVLSAVSKLYWAMKEARDKTDEAARRIVFEPAVVDALMKVSNCPDYIVNRGHYFGTGQLGEEPSLTDEEKLALIRFVKTF